MAHRILSGVAAATLLLSVSTALAEPQRGTPQRGPLATLSGTAESRALPVPMPDLFPQAVLQAHSEQRPELPPPAPRRLEPRDTPTFALGDDRDWRVQAAQIAGMTGAFAALAVLCADGACMLP
jgi:hypothetical protein